MTKEQLRTALVTAGMLLTMAAAYMVGPLAFLKAWLGWSGALLTGLAANDGALDFILQLIGSGAITLPHKAGLPQPKPHELAMLEKPLAEHLEGAAEQMTA